MNRLAVFILVFALGGCTRSAETPAAPVPIQVAAVVADTTPGGGSLAGRIEATHAAVISGEVAERVVLRPIQRGDRVRKGQVLVLFREDTIAQQLAQAEAAARRATAALRQAEAGLARARVETQALVESASAGVSGAVAQESKARTYTRAQELHSAQAALAAARADEALADKELVRYRTLVASDAAPQQALDRALAAQQAAQAKRREADQALSLAQEGARREDQATASARVTQARASLESARTRPLKLRELEAEVEGLRAQEAEAQAAAAQIRIRLDKCRVRAPFDAVVLETRIESGELATLGQPLVKLGDIRQVKAMFNVTEAARRTLRLGQSMRVTVDALAAAPVPEGPATGRAFQGRLTVLGPEADDRTRAFPIEVSIDNRNMELLPNMIVRLDLYTRPRASLSVPVCAVATHGEQAQVFVVRGRRAVARTVHLGEPRGDRVEVLDGLTEGETVALTPIRLADGLPIQVVTP